ncbi:MAG: hypothetical protein EP329_21900 [Deltaproteobacteria bacterium]|nr:MAG: hypothetical protein EP329_21900 [Deltaproteobacteria bacterium]
MRLFNTMTLLLAAGALTLFAACGDDNNNDTDTTQDTVSTDTGDDTMESDTNVEQDTTVTGDFATLVFTIDDSANKTYDATDGLAWKGSFAYDAATNIVELDTTWGGPFPMLYDDGTHGDATANDNIWTCAILVATPEADVTFEYGAVSGSVDGSDGSWIWNKSSNGTVTVSANETGTVTADGMVVEAFGSTDLKLTIDLSNSAENLDALFAGADYTTATVKGNKWGWNEVTMLDDGTKGDDTASDGIYTFLLSENLGKHEGLLKTGDQAAFVFVLDGVEYKVGGAPVSTGVNAFLNSGSGFEPAAIMNYPEGDKNTYVEVGAEPFNPPANHVAVNFTIDDSINQTYEDGDGLAWKGSFNFNAETRVLAKDGSWGGPFPMLYDDGPWSAGGHEPAGATAGDHIWGVTVWVDNSAAVDFEYGAIRGSVDGSDGDWIWVGSNGTFSVIAGDATAIDADGLVIPAFGTTDMKLEIDSANVSSLFTGATAFKVKGSAWGWAEVVMTDDATKGDGTASDGIFTFVLSENTGKHTGLLNSGDAPQFVFVIDGVEYKTDGAADATGVTAYTKAEGGDWTAATVETQTDGDKNTYITAP